MRFLSSRMLATRAHGRPTGTRSVVAVIALALAVCVNAPSHVLAQPSEPPIEPAAERRADSAPWADSPLADDVLYQVMPIAWRDSDGGSGSDPSRDPDINRDGDFHGMRDAIPYLGELGVTGLWTTPVFPSPAYHGYQHAEADRVNPALGTEEQFLDFNRAMHAAGLRIFIDLVAYGINRDSDVYRAAMDQSSPLARFIAIKDAATREPFGYEYRTSTGAKVSFAFFDLRNAGARELVTRWSLKWLDPTGVGDRAAAVDGYRLDHVWASYPEGPDGWGYSVENFWKPWKAALIEKRSDVITFAEQAKWETFGADLLPAHDATFAKPFLFAAREAIRTSSAAALHAAIERTIGALPGEPRRRTFLVTLGDHDVDRLASALGATTEQTSARLKAAGGVLLTQPFPPVIYFGDELGMLGVAGRFGSDANDIPRREPFKWNAVDSFPMTNYLARHAGASEKRYSKDHDGRSVEEQRGVPGSLLETYRSLIALRRATPALRRGGYLALESSDPRVWACARSCPDQSVLVAVRLGTAAAGETEVNLPEGFEVGQELTSHEAEGPKTEGGVVRIDLEPGQTRVFVLAAARGAR